ncbi:MAG: ABC transporter ATP-binding protein [Planctomycetota bacterium]
MSVPTATDTALELVRVTQHYRSGFLGRRRCLFDGLSFRLGAGERWGLVGPNGSGKSTLLRLASGVEAPSSGTVRVFGSPLTSFEARRRIGYVPEGFPFPRDLDAQRALTLIGVVGGAPRDAARERARELLVRVGLGGNERRRLAHFSRGMQQRFAIAQAFVATPDLLLLDEPTTGLDALGFALLEELLAEAGARGATSLVCSHLVGDLVAHADRLAVLVEGRLRLAGTVGELAWRGARLRVELEGIDEAGWPALVRAVESQGGRIVERAPSNQALLELFRSP